MSPDEEQLRVFESLIAEDMQDEELQDYYLKDTLPEVITYFAEDEKLQKELTGICLDRGLAQTREFVAGDERITQPGVSILNRNSFISYFEPQIEAGENPTFIKFDVKSLREADNTKDAEENSYADIILNQTGLSITKAAAKANKALASMGLQTARVVPARYGGDEFMLGFENVPPKLCDVVSKLVEKEMEHVPGAYTDYKGATSVLFRGLRVGEMMEVPSNPIKREIFELFFDRMILDEQDVDLMYFQLDDSDLEYLRIEKAKALNIQELKNRHGYLLSRMTNYAGNRGAAKAETFHTKIAQFIEHYANDRLLKDKVDVFEEFVEWLQAGELEKAFLIEVPIKPINDNLSMAHGDAVILSIWEQVAKHVPPDLRAHIRPVRKGGTLILGIAKDTPMNMKSRVEEALDKVKNRSEANISIGGLNMGFMATVSVTEVDLRKGENPKKFISNMFADSKMTWLGTFIEKHWQTPEYFDFTDRPLSGRDIANDRGFIQQYLYGDHKRQKERILSALAVFEQPKKFIRKPDKKADTFPEYLADIQNRLRQALRQIEE